MSLPWILVNHVLTSPDPGMIECVIKINLTALLLWILLEKLCLTPKLSYATLCIDMFYIHWICTTILQPLRCVRFTSSIYILKLNQRLIYVLINLFIS